MDLTENPQKHLPVEELTFEEALKELEEIVETLESNEKNLTEAMKLYERGKELARYCAALLDEAELKVQMVDGEKFQE